ncbi:hypothetical protein KJ605_00865 [Patescibacteria group bacterium]|nr:hypothetical protein [Patescibacteria group bacterium]
MAKPLTGAQIRQKFVDYYKALEHVEIENVSLIPKNDPTTLFIGSGMQQLVPYFLGKPHPLGKRFVNVQRCLRAEDLEEIGNARHHSFFEMLGCWSLGDYFKTEQIPWTFNFFVDELGIDARKLYVTVFAGEEGLPKDTESAEIWKQTFAQHNMTAEATEDIYSVGDGNYRIFYYPKNKNWWERSGAPIGDPAGPDSEIFYFTGLPHDPKFGARCHLNCDCGRYIEIGNDVFIQYKKVSPTAYEPLAQKNVDCGWGLERITRVVQGKNTNFETDLFYPMIQRIETLTQSKYGETAAVDWVYRITADHMRAAVFLMADGVVPGNKLQGYVLRRLLRRVIFQSQKLNSPHNFLAEVAQVVINEYGSYYRQLQKAGPGIISQLSEEEAKFKRTLDKGLKEMEKLAVKSNRQLNSEQLELLYQTYGVPQELTKEICQEKGWTLV